MSYRIYDEVKTIDGNGVISEIRRDRITEEVILLHICFLRKNYKGEIPLHFKETSPSIYKDYLPEEVEYR